MHCDITIQTAPFDLGAEEAALRAQAGDAGALVAFQGMVRGHDAAIPLTALFLEHYPGVTEAEIRRIAEDAAATLAADGGTGHSPRGQPSARRGHRASAGGLCCINQLQVELPQSPDGSIPCGPFAACPVL